MSLSSTAGGGVLRDLPDLERRADEYVAARSTCTSSAATEVDSSPYSSRREMNRTCASASASAAPGRLFGEDGSPSAGRPGAAVVGRLDGRSSGPPRAGSPPRADFGRPRPSSKGPDDDAPAGVRRRARREPARARGLRRRRRRRRRHHFLLRTCLCFCCCRMRI